MLLQFKVKNFHSIKSEAIMSMMPSSDSSHSENLGCIQNCKAIKSAAIYGANAAGKSTMIQAFVAAIMAVRLSDTRNITQKIPNMIPFKFDETTANSPCSFEFYFVANNQKRYRYGFTADSTRIHEEYLYYYASSRPSRIFERTGDQFEFNQIDKPEFSEFEQKNTSNKLFLATATNWGSPKTAPAYQWLADAIDVYLSEMNNPAILQFYENDEKSELKQFALSLFRQADINISDFQIEITNLGETQETMGITNFQGKAISQSHLKAVTIRTGHQVKCSDGSKQNFYLDLREESQGTNQLFWIAPILKEVIGKGKTMVIDELDRSLHPFLVKFLVELFHNPDLNKKNAQLIFTTHDTTLLSLDTFRRDQIYFVEKDPHTAATELYSLDEFSVRKSENIEKGYLLGRYGAVPYVHPEGEL